MGLKQNSLDISAAFVMSLEFVMSTGAQSASVGGSLGASLLEVVWSGHPGASCPEQCFWWLNM